MRNPELQRQLDRLRALIKNTAAATGGDLELQSEWGRYVCVLAAGFVEKAQIEIYSEFAFRAASRPVAAYVAARLRRVLNPKAATLTKTARDFKAEWASSLEAFMEVDGRKDAIDSIMANRHLIAHGRHSGITVARVREYLERSVEVVEYLETQCTR